ncbi:hypothetical protein [Flavonifractor plautii]|uniref:Uncharacterized protein n=1 Tax=Flavonifractor plautii TaxID=292800 RepID=A0AAW6CG16_FLAPL|nr:hypothetical protein [Flavonifractor plautii]MDB7934473.1 hypothetical protein [Flavonifractor plautii]MDB7939458.1 hypothetical protein [Flavonifractor plautii]
MWSNTTAIMGQWWGINSPWRKENAPEVLATMEDMIGVASREELARILCTAEFCECCDYKKDSGVCHYIEEHPDGLLFDGCVEAAKRWLGKIVEKL